jgi:uncharacterized protein
MQHDALARPHTAFVGQRRLVTGPLGEVALAVKRVLEGDVAEPVLIYDDTTGNAVDLDTRGSDDDVLARLAPPMSAEPRGRGRPKLGVVAREVTLLPRHWEWLNAQPGGASVALRKLVEEARRAGGERDRVRQTQEAAYRFMSAMAGDLPGFEEASRALFARDRTRFTALIAGWPPDIRDYATALAFTDRA